MKGLILLRQYYLINQAIFNNLYLLNKFIKKLIILTKKVFHRDEIYFQIAYDQWCSQAFIW